MFVPSKGGFLIREGFLLGGGDYVYVYVYIYVNYIETPCERGKRVSPSAAASPSIRWRRLAEARGGLAEKVRASSPVDVKRRAAVSLNKSRANHETLESYSQFTK